VVPFSTSQVEKIDLTGRGILSIAMRLGFVPNKHPSAYAIAVFAYWIGPVRGDFAILNRFAYIPDFDQLLLRDAISKLMVRHEF